MINPTLLILAAGTGSRYAGVKWNDPVGPDGQTLMEYSMFDARRAGFGRIVFVIRPDQEKLAREYVASRFGRRMPLEYVLQDIHRIPPGYSIPSNRTRPWGTTHAVLGSAGAIHEPFAVINLSDFYGAQSFCGMVAHLRSGSPDHAMVGLVLRNTLSDFGAVPRGVCEIDGQNYLKKIVEMRDIEKEGGHARNVDSSGREVRLTGNEVVSMNFWGFMPSIFTPLRQHFLRFLEQHHDDPTAECFLPNTVNSMIQEGQIRVKVLPSLDEWFGLTYREDYPRAVAHMRHLIDDGHYPRRLWA